MTNFKHLMVLGSACIALMVPRLGHADDAAQELAFQPAKPWEVASIKPVSDYSGECIIKTEFNNGFLFQINGSSNWVQQLDLNIRQDAFEAGKNYDVVLNVPGTARETLSAKAHRANIISVPLKGKKELYKAMRDNGVVDLAIEGNEFRFFLTAFNAAANQFERCMAGGAPGRVAAKNVRDSETVEVSNSDGGLGGIVVTTEGMSESEKDFMINESIAFEEQEAAVSEMKKAAPAPVENTPAPVEKASQPPAPVETAPEAAADVPELTDEEQAVADLNASALELARKRDRQSPVAVIREDKPKPVVVDFTGLDVAPEPVKTPDAVVEPAIDADEPAVAMLPEDIPSKEDLVEKESFIMEVNTVNAAPVETIIVEETDAQPPVDMPVMPIMPQSDVDAAESLLSEPETSIDMPQVKTTKNVAKANVDFSTPQIENADQTALARIVALEKELEAARVENAALNDELQVTLKEGKQEIVSVESRNWNLEKATMRYNEAERQMKKLGQQLQKERAQHAMERKELEAMLFDPAVTEQEQLARLSKLEQELAAARAALEAARAGVGQ